MTTSLQSELDAVEPALNELARNLGQAPEKVLRDAIEAKRKEWALQQLEDAVAEAKASGAAEVPDIDTYFEEKKVALRERHADRL